MSDSFSVNNGSSKKLRNINIDGCPVIGEGMHAVVYKTQPDEIVKVYRPGIAIEKIEGERKLARWAFVKGLPTAIPFDVVTVGDRYGVVFELLDATSAIDYIHQSQECFDDFIAKSVDLLKEIHSIEVTDLPDMKENTIKWARDVREDLSGDIFAELEKIIDQIPDSHTLLHADFHIKNILVCKGELMLIDMDTLSKGNPIFELASVYNSYCEFPSIDPEAAALIGITVDMGKELWAKTLKLYYQDASEEELQMIERRAQIIGCLRIIDVMKRHIEHPASGKCISRCLEDIEKAVTGSW